MICKIAKCAGITRKIMKCKKCVLKQYCHHHVNTLSDGENIAKYAYTVINWFHNKTHNKSSIPLYLLFFDNIYNHIGDHEKRSVRRFIKAFLDLNYYKNLLYSKKYVNQEIGFICLIYVIDALQKNRKIIKFTKQHKNQFESISQNMLKYHSNVALESLSDDDLANTLNIICTCKKIKHIIYLPLSDLHKEILNFSLNRIINKRKWTVLSYYLLTHYIFNLTDWGMKSNNIRKKSFLLKKCEMGINKYIKMLHVSSKYEYDSLTFELIHCYDILNGNMEKSTNAVEICRKIRFLGNNVETNAHKLISYVQMIINHYRRHHDHV